MAQLRQDYQAFVDREAEIIAVGPEDPESFDQFWEEHQMPFTGIPDPDHRLADLYGQEVHLLKLGRMPALFVIDKNGEIVYLHYGGSMQDITPNEEVLALLDELNRGTEGLSTNGTKRHEDGQAGGK